jgi:molybdate transport system substrate-binding protein
MNILSAGAAKGLLHAVAATEEISLEGEFGAVGAISERLKAGASCDVIILTATMIAELAANGEVDAASVIALGKVSTGVALLNEAPLANVDDPDSLKQLLSQAEKLYFPDPSRATAGIHFMKVLTALGLAETHRERFATYPNGATAMRAMADAGDVGAVGITQCSEILYTEGVRYVGALPNPYELATIYSAAMATRVENTDEARRLLNALASANNERARVSAGFEPFAS